MTWFAWRLQRLPFLVAAGVAVGFAVWLVSVGLHEEARWTYFSQQGCLRPLRYQTVYCEGFNPYNFTHWNPYFDGVLAASSGLVGLLMGAPLVAREMEHGTNRFAWAQSITRTRWLVTKLLVGGSMAGVIAAGLTALGYWWTHAVHARSDVLPQNFDETGIVVLAYTLCAFLLGAALGAVFRRTGWAIFVGIPLFGAFRLFVRYDVRSHLAPTIAASVAPNTTVPQAWQIHSGYLPVGLFNPPAGLTWNHWPDIVQNCVYRAFRQLPNGGRQLDDPERATEHCAAVHRLHFVVQYQPSTHFWMLQTAETVIFVGIAALLLGATVLAVRRWRS
jgi:hypothetical protein